MCSSYSASLALCAGSGRTFPWTYYFSLPGQLPSWTLTCYVPGGRGSILGQGRKNVRRGIVEDIVVTNVYKRFKLKKTCFDAFLSSNVAYF